MRLPVEFYIARKYLLAKRKQTFISIITFISIGGVTVGVMALIIVLAVMSGFERELKERILGATAHAHVTSLNGSIENPFAVTERVRKVDGVVAASPYIFTPMMIASGSGAVGGVLRGVDTATVGDVTRLRRDLRVGRLEDLHRATKDGLPGAILGKELAGNLGVGPGEVIEVLVPGGTITPLGAFPKTARF
ncbi:MAG TPA: ABC transporter permease, partial [Candidatus Deferrimicrobium sp.]|nr:ABC transporter permease [Candidatus Deferrimicrobium sp.]